MTGCTMVHNCSRGVCIQGSNRPKDKLSGMSGISNIFERGGHGEEREYFSTHVCHIDLVNNIGAKQICFNTGSLSKERDHTKEQGCTG